jgi:hypothetical protein
VFDFVAVGLCCFGLGLLLPRAAVVALLCAAFGASSCGVFVAFHGAPFALCCLRSFMLCCFCHDVSFMESSSSCMSSSNAVQAGYHPKYCAIDVFECFVVGIRRATGFDL